MTEQNKLHYYKFMTYIDSEAVYRCDVPVSNIPNQINDYIKQHNLQLNPDFQRGRVWTKKQQISYVEYIIRGGVSAKIVYFNCPHWGNFIIKSTYQDFVCVDGLQRISSFIDFYDNKFPIFNGYYAKDFNSEPILYPSISFRINNLRTKAEVLQWYIELNTTGKPHTIKEIEKVKKLIELETKNG